MWSVLAETLSSFLPERRNFLYLSWALADQVRLERLFADAGFQDIRVERDIRSDVIKNFDEYWEPIETGTGQQPQSYLDPLDVADRDQMAWLRALVWPEQTGRRDRLDAAIRVAAAEPPRLVRGDLRHDLAALCADAPTGATLVILHKAVLAYVVDRAERAEFAEAMASLCDFWIANEAPHIFPDVAARAGAGSPGSDMNVTGTPTGGGRFLLSVNGDPVGWADPHGAWLDWIANPPLSYRQT
jgi:hypothetical protein